MEAKGIGEMLPDVANPVYFRNGTIHRLFATMRKESPLFYQERHPLGPFWSVCDYDTIVEVERRTADFTSTKGIAIEDGIAGLTLPMLITSDPPLHKELRAAYDILAMKGWLEEAQVAIQAAVSNALDQSPTARPFDAALSLAKQIPSYIMAHLLEVDWHKWHLLAKWAEAGVGSLSLPLQIRHQRLSECWSFFQPRLEAYLQSADDSTLLSRLVRTLGGPISPERYLGHLVLILVGGLDTVRNSILASILFVDKSPGLFSSMQTNPSLIQLMLDEAIRLQTPLAHMRRTATVDTSLAGEVIKRGEKIVLWYISGNRDESVFPEPDVFDPYRKGQRPALAFGWGIHRCVGARLGMMALHSTWTNVLYRYAGARVMHQPVRTLSTFVNGFDSFPMQFTDR